MNVGNIKLSISDSKYGSRLLVGIQAKDIARGYYLWSVFLEVREGNEHSRRASVAFETCPEGVIATLQNGHKFWLSLTDGTILRREPDTTKLQIENIFSLVEKLDAMNGWDVKQIGDLTYCRLARQRMLSSPAVTVFGGETTSAEVPWKRIELRLGTSKGTFSGMLALVLNQPFLIETPVLTIRYGKGVIRPEVACGGDTEPAYIEYRTDQGVVRWGLTRDLKNVCYVSIDHGHGYIAPMLWIG
jgi:hypothetical protein